MHCAQGFKNANPSQTKRLNRDSPIRVLFILRPDTDVAFSIGNNMTSLRSPLDGVVTNVMGNFCFEYFDLKFSIFLS